MGYGRWTDELQSFKGAVCCWSLKNPVYPERKYKFDKPITCLDFSKTNANILIAGSYGGFIYTLDITQEMCTPTIINRYNLLAFSLLNIIK